MTSKINLSARLNHREQRIKINTRKAYCCVEKDEDEKDGTVISYSIYV